MKVYIASLLLILLSACGGSAPSDQPLASPSASQPFYNQDPALVDNSTLPVTPLEDLHETGRPVEIDIQEYRLVVDGLVERPLSLEYEELRSLPQVSEVVLLICPGFFADNARWTGTPLVPLLEEAGLRPGAHRVKFYSADGYSSVLTLDEALAEGTFLAYEVNGQTLPLEHGYPLRLVVRHQYGGRWVKWLTRIEVM